MTINGFSVTVPDQNEPVLVWAGESGMPIQANIEAGALVISNHRGMLVRAFAPGRWLEAQLVVKDV